MGLFAKKKAATVVDPVCGMTIDPAKAVGTEVHDGQTFYFCSQNCLDTFRKDPHQYAHG